jgi:hypothetical protein
MPKWLVLHPMQKILETLEDPTDTRKSTFLMIAQVA